MRYRDVLHKLAKQRDTTGTPAAPSQAPAQPASTEKPNFMSNLIETLLPLGLTTAAVIKQFKQKFSGKPDAYTMADIREMNRPAKVLDIDPEILQNSYRQRASHIV